jgi:ribosomal protein L32
MALIKCPECGNSISEHAPSCPHCGIPKKTTDSFFRDPARKLTTKEKLVLFTIIIVLLLFYAWATGRLF